MIDGVLADCAGYALSQGGMGPMLRTPYAWLLLAPFPDVDFPALQEAMETGQFVGYFLAGRPPLDTPGSLADPRYLTSAWLRRQCGASFEGHIVADLQPSSLALAEFLVERRVDYFLSSDPLQASAAWQAGVGAYCLDRSSASPPPGACFDYVPSVPAFLGRTVYAPQASPPPDS